MADYIRVSTQNIGRDRETIQKELDGIEKSVEGLYQEMQSLGQTWEGAAWQNFQGQVAADVENMRLVGERISGFLEHMEYARKEYQSCADRVGSLVDSIRI